MTPKERIARAALLMNSHPYRFPKAARVECQDGTVFLFAADNTPIASMPMDTWNALQKHVSAKETK